VTLPLYQSSPVELLHPPTAASNGQPPKPRFLVVDEDPAVHRLVSALFAPEGHAVEAVRSGEQALRLAREGSYDMIIADIGMPGIDGYELCSRLRQNPSTRTIPFIFLTGHDDDTERIKARKVGSDDYLTKPCAFERLIHSVEAVMDRIEQARRIFNLDAVSPYYSVALLIGIVLFSFFADATIQGMIALVHRESLLRRMRFQRIVIPVAATLTAGWRSRSRSDWRARAATPRSSGATCSPTCASS
jgi:DNA-binding response OmpR family regulator